MSSQVGITVPRMLPITGSWAAPFTAYLLLLNGRVVYERLTNKTFIGDTTGKPTEDGEYDSLKIATSCHRNYVENIPLALALAAIVELNGGNRRTLNTSLAALFLFRVIHVEFGLKGRKALALGRPLGYYGTMGFLGGMAGYAVYLVKDYWGF